LRRRWATVAAGRDCPQPEGPKDKILERLQQRGNSDQAAQTDQELPDQVDPERDSSQLEKFGLKPRAVSKLGGGIPGLLSAVDDNAYGAPRQAA